MHPVCDGKLKYRTSRKDTNDQSCHPTALSPLTKIVTSLQNCKHLELTRAPGLCLWGINNCCTVKHTMVPRKKVQGMNLRDMMLKLVRPSDVFCQGCGPTSSCLDILFIRLQASFSKGIYGADQHHPHSNGTGNDRTGEVIRFLGGSTSLLLILGLQSCKWWESYPGVSQLLRDAEMGVTGHWQSRVTSQEIQFFTGKQKSISRCLQFCNEQSKSW